MPTLRALIAARHEPLAVYTQPDRPAGRGRQLRASPVKQLAVDAGLALQQPASLAEPEVQTILADYQPDLMIVAAYGLLLPPAVLAIPRLGCVNIHASLLPRWRGAAPIQRAILAGDHVTGISLMQMAAGLDTGPILAHSAIPIAANDNAQQLHDALAELGAKLLLEKLPLILAQELSAEPQDETLANYAAKLTKQDAWLDWSLPAVALDRQIRAFNPWPVAQTQLGSTVLRIWHAQIIDSDATFDQARPGQIIATSPMGIDVLTGDGILRLLRLQLPGAKALAVADFINAHDLNGQRLGE